MILEIRPLYAGNALQLFLKPEAGFRLTRVLRKATNDIVDQDDAQAEIVYEGTEPVVVDVSPSLKNEIPVWYRAFDFFGGFTWVASPSMSGTPLATYEDNSTDVQELLRDRIEKGLAVEVLRNVLKPGKSGAIACLTAPPVAEETDWPVATVQLLNELPGERGVGEIFEIDHMDFLTDEWIESEGWLADVQLLVAMWCTNADERIELRKALRRILIANLGVFASQGIEQVQVQASDAEFLNGEYGPVNVFQTNVTFSCKAPVVVRDRVAKVVDVITDPIPVFN